MDNGQKKQYTHSYNKSLLNLFCYYLAAAADDNTMRRKKRRLIANNVSEYYLGSIQGVRYHRKF